MDFVLELKDGTKKSFNLSSMEEGIVDQKRVANLIRKLMDDEYNITEDIKQDAIKRLREAASV